MTNKTNRVIFIMMVIAAIMTIALYGAYIVVGNHLSWFTGESGVGLATLINGIDNHARCMSIIEDAMIVSWVFTLVLAIIDLITVFGKKEEA